MCKKLQNNEQNITAAIALQTTIAKSNSRALTGQILLCVLLFIQEMEQQLGTNTP